MDLQVEPVWSYTVFHTSRRLVRECIEEHGNIQVPTHGAAERKGRLGLGGTGWEQNPDPSLMVG